MKHTIYNTNLRQDETVSVQVLFNEMEMPIVFYDSGADVFLWVHNSIDAQLAEDIVYEQLERTIYNNHLQLVQSYATFNFYSIPHAMAVASREDSVFRNALKDVPYALKSLDAHFMHMKTIALNPSQFSILSDCPYCTQGVHIADVALISIGVPLVESESQNIHGRNRVAIDHICRNCTEGVNVE